MVTHIESYSDRQAGLETKGLFIIIQKHAGNKGRDTVSRVKGISIREGALVLVQGALRCRELL